MSQDFVSEVDKKFFEDNLLVTEDWDADLSRFENDFSSLLDVESNLTVDELIRQIPDGITDASSDLQLPVLEDKLPSDSIPCGDIGDITDQLVYGEHLMDLGSDGSDSGIESVTVKDEPLSPASSHTSENSNDSGMGQAIPMDSSSPWISLGFSSGLEVKNERQLHSPPSCSISPPPGSPSSSSSSSSPSSSTSQTPFILNPVVSLPSSPVAGSLGKSGILTNSGITVLKPSSPPAGTKNQLQPKPVAPIQPKTTLQAQPGKPLVLTAEEFAQLTAQGILKFHPPTKELGTVKAESVPCTVPANVTTPATSLLMGTTLSQDSDTRALKRQQRMIKNRESACLSRKRKKEYLHSLEMRLKESAMENEKLKQENITLKRKLSQLQTEHEQLKLNKVPTKKVGVVLFSLMFFMWVNTPFSSLISSNTGSLQLSPESLNHHSSRNLLSVPASLEDSDKSLQDANLDIPGKPFNANIIQDALNNLQHSLRQSYSSASSGSSANPATSFWRNNLENLNIPISMCPSYFNSTESQRLMKELTGWVMGHQNDWIMRQGEEVHKREQPPRKRNKKRYFPPRKLKAAMKGKDVNMQAAESDQHGAYEVQVFSGSDPNYNDFLDSIHRRNDTFYVVSFRRDHLLLPATAHNKTMRPRMSLVMPAVALNESMQPGAGQIAMMQIDCEVMATKLVHVDKAAVPRRFNDTESRPPPSSENSHQSSTQEQGHTQGKGQSRPWRHYKRDNYDE